MKILKPYIFAALAWAFTTVNAQEAHDSIATSVNGEKVKYRVVYVHDTIYAEAPAKQDKSKDLMRVKAIGRFDRGIENYRFIPRKKWIGGITASYVNLEMDDNQLLYSILKDVDINGRILSVKPFFGYAVTDNNVIGLKFGYSQTMGELGNLALNIDDLEFNMKNLRYTSDTYSAAFFHRSYVGIDAGKRFGVFNETSLSYSYGTSAFSREENGTPKRTETTLNELHLGLNPGVAVFIMENVCAEVSFGVIGFKYLWEDQRNNLGEIGKRHSSGADFKINLFNINIGITLCI